MNRAASPASSSDPVFAAFVARCTVAIQHPENPQATAREIGALMRELAGNWSMPDRRYLGLQPKARYASYLLYMNDKRSLCIILDIFARGQRTGIHNHLTWGAVCCLAGVEAESAYDVPVDLSCPPRESNRHIWKRGDTTCVLPGAGDFHQVSCASDTPSISLHIYGADIGALERMMWDEGGERYVAFRSGYSNGSMDLGPYLTDNV